MKRFLKIIITVAVFAGLLLYGCKYKKKETMEKSMDSSKYERNIKKLNNGYALYIDKNTNLNKLQVLSNHIKNEKIKIVSVRIENIYNKEYIKYLKNFNDLIYLHIVDTDLRDNFSLSDIKDLKTLKVLNLRGTILPDTLKISDLYVLPALDHVNLTRSNVKNEFLTGIDDNNSITEILLNITNVDNNIFNLIENYKKPLYVELYGTKVSYRNALELEKKNKNIKLRLQLPYPNIDDYELKIYKITEETFLYDRPDKNSNKLSTLTKGTEVKMLNMVFYDDLDEYKVNKNQYLIQNTINTVQGWGKFKIKNTAKSGYIHLRYIINFDIKNSISLPEESVYFTIDI